MTYWNRFMKPEEEQDFIEKFPESFASVGLNDGLEWITQTKRVAIDIAHGHSDRMLDLCKKIKDRDPSIQIIAGNICTARAVHDLYIAGVDAVKVGIGPGCFAAGTRILLSNGTYKNIEEIETGDCIISGEGIPVMVKRAWKSGYKEIVSVSTNTFYSDILCTPDHKYLVGDLNSTSKTTIASKGYAKLLNEKSKTIPKASKIKWKSLENLERGCFLSPRIIQFEMPKSFSVEIKKRCGGNWRIGHKYNIENIITPSYDSGYVFGTFLGDGHAAVSVFRGSTRGNVSWYFGRNEEHIANKLNSSLQRLFGKEAKIEYRKNMIKVVLYSLPFARFLLSFGKRDKKHLPEHLLVEDIQYLLGLRDGLIDSDGHIALDGRVSFSNTSIKLIELYNVVFFLTNGYFPNNQRREPSAGGLDANVENCKPSYIARSLGMPDKRLIKDYQIVKRLGQKKTNLFLDVYDIEVDDESHSFLANNVIVHNSACTTRSVTGFGVPQWTAIKECADAAKDYDLPVIADGGIRNSRDIVLALAAGASSVMIGKLFAATEESAAKKSPVYSSPVRVEGYLSGYRCRYRGQASEEFQEEFFGKVKNVPEGDSGWIDVSGPAQELIDELLGGIRSGLTYGGARNIKELQRKAEFIQVTPSYNAEMSTRIS